VRERIEYHFRVPSAAVFTLYSYSKVLEYRFRVLTASSLISPGRAHYMLLVTTNACSDPFPLDDDLIMHMHGLAIYPVGHNTSCVTLCVLMMRAIVVHGSIHFFLTYI
jgi:hypothetical protein